jgi:hypothetical protein
MKLITQHLPIKKAKVHRLPTEDKGVIVIRADKPNVLMLERNSPYAVYGKGGSYESKEHTYKHLYFTNDEKIKEGDWYLDTQTNTVYRCDSHKESLSTDDFNEFRKITASTLQRNVVIVMAKDILIKMGLEIVIVKQVKYITYPNHLKHLS